ncbi:MAG TPA: LuxR C-terminal-related transcriptional regulator [Chloroflexota bacterium]|nr:LuxR C-terminal-related transcriptional regulator [Chloroflexota bacterium]
MPLLAAAVEATYHTGQWTALGEVLRLATSLAPAGDTADDLLLRLLIAAGRLSSAAQRETLPADVVRDFARVEELDDPALLVRASELAWGLGDYDLGRRLLRKAVTRARALGAAGTLAWALENMTLEALWHGDLAIAEAHAQEGHRLALAAGHPNVACRHLSHLALLAALRGQEEETRRLAGEVLTEATARRLDRQAATANEALGLLALGAGRAVEALEHLEAIWSRGATPGHEGVAVNALPDLVEAAVRAGEPARAATQLETYLERMASSRAPAVQALVARCRALMATGAEAEAHFREALRLHTASHRPLDHARTELLYGEFLRRDRRRVEARIHLRIALETFERLGLASWVERARAELRASGERARQRDPSTFDRLTPQELQIVRAVSQGTTNREVAAQFFLSPRTVAYHLRKVFSKLGISSRAELIRLAHSSDTLGLEAGGAPLNAGAD